MCAKLMIRLQPLAAHGNQAVARGTVMVAIGKIGGIRRRARVLAIDVQCHEPCVCLFGALTSLAGVMHVCFAFGWLSKIHNIRNT